MAQAQSRRSFLRNAPLAAATLTLGDTLAFAQAVAPAPETFQVFTASALATDASALQAKPGNNNLFDPKTVPFSVVMTTEVNKAAKEFEWHEGRDHIVQIIDGTTVYEVGGTPKGGRTTKPGEWLAPASEGSKSLVLVKGDMLVIPRSTPHKRSTEDSVTFYLISTTGVAKS